MLKYIVSGLVIIAVVVAGLSLIDLRASTDINAQVFLADAQADISGYERAIAPYGWQFPADYGPHPTYQTEWWYYTGNLGTDDGRRFGYQFTVFRRAIAPTPPEANASEWRTNQIYMAHFTLADVDGETFYHDQRFSRGGASLASATSGPDFRVWLDDWQVIALNDEATLTRLAASTTNVTLDLRLEQFKPPALHGDNGLSAKDDTPGNASYYYSLSRLLADGTITVEGETFRVTGTTWMDHEFSTSALGADAQGWDWFGLHLGDGRDLMLGQIRLVDGGTEAAFGGTLVEPNGDTRKLTSRDFSISSSGTWNSPHTGATYPAGWQLTVDVGQDRPLNLTLTPLLSDQELTGGIAYWEGAVRITGDVTGYGYVELTGYVGTMNGRF